MNIKVGNYSCVYLKHSEELSELQWLAVEYSLSLPLSSLFKEKNEKLIFFSGMTTVLFTIKCNFWKSFKSNDDFPVYQKWKIIFNVLLIMLF